MARVSTADWHVGDAPDNRSRLVLEVASELIGNTAVPPTGANHHASPGSEQCLGAVED